MLGVVSMYYSAQVQVREQLCRLGFPSTFTSVLDI